jgi:hypothetical protein
MATRKTMFMAIAYAGAIITIVMIIATYILGGRPPVIYPG